MALLFPALVYANSVSIGPTKILSDMSPGETKTFEITVLNDTNRDLSDYEIIVRELILLKESNSFDIDSIKQGKNKNPQSFVNFVKLPDKLFTIKKKSFLKIPLVVTLPSDAKGSGYFSYVVRAQEKKKKNTVQVRTNFNGLVAINVKNKENFNLKIKQSQFKKEVIKIEVENIGLGFVEISGEALILNEKQEQVAKIVLANQYNQDKLAMYPQKQYWLNSALSGLKLKKGQKYKVLVNLKDEKRKFIKSELIDLSIQ